MVPLGEGAYLRLSGIPGREVVLNFTVGLAVKRIPENNVKL